MFALDDWILTQLFMWKKFYAKSKLKIKKKIAGNTSAKKAILFFPYWSGESEIYNFLSKRLGKEYTFVYYDYPKEIMSKNLKVSMSYLRQILKDAFFLILELRKKGYTEITLVGSSLGSNISLKLATMVRVDKIVLNMIDRSLAREIFTSPAMTLLRKRLEKQGLNLKNMEQIYGFISPEKLIPILKLTKTKVLLLLSKNDIFCNLTEFQPVLKILDRTKVDYKLKINYILGHILSIYKNLYLGNTIPKFIKEN